MPASRSPPGTPRAATAQGSCTVRLLGGRVRSIGRARNVVSSRRRARAGPSLIRFGVRPRGRPVTLFPFVIGGDVPHDGALFLRRRVPARLAFGHTSARPCRRKAAPSSIRYTKRPPGRRHRWGAPASWRPSGTGFPPTRCRRSRTPVVNPGPAHPGNAGVPPALPSGRPPATDLRPTPASSDHRTPVAGRRCGRDARVPRGSAKGRPADVPRRSAEDCMGKGSTAAPPGPSAAAQARAAPSGALPVVA